MGRHDIGKRAPSLPYITTKTPAIGVVSEQPVSPWASYTLVSCSSCVNVANVNIGGCACLYLSLNLYVFVVFFAEFCHYASSRLAPLQPNVHVRY